jgi:two-component system cell cycle response regulator
MTRILIIEDNVTNLELMSYLLTAFGYTTLSASDGESGLDLARRESPDLIVCDIQLPEMDGYEVVGHLKDDAATSKIPLVAVTAFAMVGDRDRAMTAGFDGYITKPIDPQTFVGQVEAFLAPAARAAPQPIEASATSQAGPPVDRRSGSILAVDNIPANLELLCSIFEPFGYAVRTARNIRAALEIARQELPDIIISDVHMPDGSGFDLLQSFKADPQLQSIRFVFLSATARQSDDIQTGLGLGADKFIRRPIEPRQLLAEIESSLRQRSDEGWEIEL